MAKHNEIQSDLFALCFNLKGLSVFNAIWEINQAFIVHDT